MPGAGVARGQITAAGSALALSRPTPNCGVSDLGVQEEAAAAAQAQPLAQAPPAVNLAEAARAARRRTFSTTAPMLSLDDLSDEMREVVSAMPLRIQSVILAPRARACARWARPTGDL